MHAARRKARYAFLLEMNARLRGTTLPIYRRDIADYLGLTIKTVSRTLPRLKEDGVVDVASRRIKVLSDSNDAAALSGTRRLKDATQWSTRLADCVGQGRELNFDRIGNLRLPNSISIEVARGLAGGMC